MRVALADVLVNVARWMSPVCSSPGGIEKNGADVRLPSRRPSSALAPVGVKNVVDDEITLPAGLAIDTEWPLMANASGAVKSSFGIVAPFRKFCDRRRMALEMVRWSSV